jgi:hypothetical protein
LILVKPPAAEDGYQSTDKSLDGSVSVQDESGNHNREVRAGREAISAVRLSQRLTADIDAWAEARNTVRSDAIRKLLEIGLRTSSSRAPHEGRSVRDDAADIEQQATAQIEMLLDPTLPADERERRTRRLIDGPPEFSAGRIDLPKHER